MAVDREQRVADLALHIRPIGHGKRIACAQEHFKAIGTEYGVATSFDDLVSQMS